MRRTRPEQGFTLVEMVVAMTLLALVAMAALPLLQMPMNTYMDLQRRTDALQSIDAVQHTLEADLAQALPGSVRVRQIGNRWWLEYLEVRASGRHRGGLSGAAQACPATCAVANNNDSLEATCSETCFTSLGALDGAAPVVASDWVVVNPQGPGVANGDPWFGGAAGVAGGIKSRLTATAVAPDGLRLSINPQTFAAVAPSKRFYVVSQPVTWECDLGSGRLTKRWGYAISAVQPVAFGAAPSAALADGVTQCAFQVQSAGGEGRSTIEMRLRLARTDGVLASIEAVELLSTYSVGAP